MGKKTKVGIEHETLGAFENASCCECLPYEGRPSEELLDPDIKVFPVLGFPQVILPADDSVRLTEDVLRFPCLPGAAPGGRDSLNRLTPRFLILVPVLEHRSMGVDVDFKPTSWEWRSMLGPVFLNLPDILTEQTRLNHGIRTEDYPISEE
jgi:hypothetical protein